MDDAGLDDDGLDVDRSIPDLFSMMEGEVNKARWEVHDCSYLELANVCIDIANFAMMIYDVIRKDGHPDDL